MCSSSAGAHFTNDFATSSTDSCWSLCLVWTYPRSVPSESILSIQCIKLMLFTFLKRNPAEQALSIFCNSLLSSVRISSMLQFFVSPWPHKCQEMWALFVFTSLKRYDWTSAPEKLPFWPESDIIGHDRVSYPTWRRPICELRYSEPFFVSWGPLIMVCYCHVIV